MGDHWATSISIEDPFKHPRLVVHRSIDLKEIALAPVSALEEEPCGRRITDNPARRSV
jgi:hypothetical protein